MKSTLSTDTRKVVVLTMDGLRLMLPQGDIRTVESVVDVEPGDPPDHGIGWIKYNGQRWPVYCLSAELGTLDHMPATRRACVLLALSDGYMGVLCDDARILISFSGQSFPIPHAMSLPGTPLSGLVNYEDGLACVTDAVRLASFAAHALSVQ